jgi:hypothetical protein
VKWFSSLAWAATRRWEKFSTQEAMAGVFKGMGSRRKIEGVVK